MFCKSGLLAALALVAAAGGGGGGGGGGSNCERPGNIHDVQIVIGMWVTFQSDFSDAWAGFLTTMPPERDTPTLRAKAVNWLWDAFGLQFDASIVGVQQCTNVAGIQFDPRIMDLSVLGENANRVYSWDDQTGASDVLFRKTEHRMQISNANIVTATYMVSAVSAEVTWTNQNTDSAHYGKQFNLAAPLNGLYPTEALVLGTHRVFVDGVAVTDESTDIVFTNPWRNPNLDPAMMKEYFFNIGHPVELDLESNLWGEGEGYGWSTTRPVDPSDPTGPLFTKNNVVLTWRTSDGSGPAGADCKDLQPVGGGSNSNSAEGNVHAAARAHHVQRHHTASSGASDDTAALLESHPILTVALVCAALAMAYVAVSRWRSSRQAKQGGYQSVSAADPLLA